MYNCPRDFPGQSPAVDCLFIPQICHFRLQYTKCYNLYMGFLGILMAQTVKNLPATRETWVWPLDWEDPLEKSMATHSCVLAWRIPWTEEPGGLQSTGSQRVWYNWVTKHITYIYVEIYIYIYIYKNLCYTPLYQVSPKIHSFCKMLAEKHKPFCQPKTYEKYATLIAYILCVIYMLRIYVTKKIFLLFFKENIFYVLL